ncbi:hypothetical protein HY837_05280 [archaeon]|nr:hypothetical protein [archaeon]
MTKELELFVTLWPEFPHYKRFASDERIAGVRMNSVLFNSDRYRHMSSEDILRKAVKDADGTRVYLDIKGRQLRVRKVVPNDNHLEIIINHDIEADLPAVALFKGGNDPARLAEIVDKRKLIFDAGPQWKVKPGESLAIRDPSLKVHGTIPGYEQETIKKALSAGVKDFMLSFVEQESDIEEFRKYVGKEGEVVAKIESLGGLSYVRNNYKPLPNTSLMTARGDLFVMVEKPHEIVKAARDIVNADPNAIAASRILLSVTNEPVPSCSDFSDMEFLLNAGYKRMMLCDGLCMEEEPLDRAVNIVESFARDRGYELVKKLSTPQPATPLQTPNPQPQTPPVKTGFLGKIFG